MDQPVSLTVKQIEDRITRLGKLKDLLLEEFASPEPTTNSRPTPAPPTRHPVIGKTRAAAVAGFLRKEGPQSRRAIVAATGFPDGTISYVLHDKTRFKLRQDGRWDVQKAEGGVKAGSASDRSQKSTQKGAGRG